MRKLAASFLALLVVAAAPARATNGMRMIGFGASQVAMGGASAALALDAASVVSNPAGITELGGRVDFGASFFKPTVSYRAAEVPGLPQPGLAVGSTERFTSKRGASPVPALGLVIPLDEQFTFGLGAYGVSGMGVDHAQNLYGGITYSSYSQMRFAPGLAWRVSDRLSVGVTANLLYAEMSYSAAQGLLQVPHQAASAFGYGATVGVQLRASEALTFGAAYETRSWFQDFEFNVPAHQPLDPTTGAPMTSGGQPVVLPAGMDQLAFDQPSSATAGVAVRPLRALTVAFDVQWIRWSETNGQNQPAYSSDVTRTGAMPWNLDWSDQWVFKVGAQLQAGPVLALRAGYNYGKSPLRAGRAFENIAFPAIAEHHLTGGVGVQLGERFALNLAAMYAPEARLTGSNPAEQFIASYETTMSQYALDAAIAYRF